MRVSSLSNDPAYDPKAGEPGHAYRVTFNGKPCDMHTVVTADDAKGLIVVVKMNGGEPVFNEAQNRFEYVTLRGDVAIEKVAA